MSRARSGSEALAEESGGDVGDPGEMQWEAGDQRRKGKGSDKRSKADADRAHARELAEAEEAVARWVFLTWKPKCPSYCCLASLN